MNLSARDIAEDATFHSFINGYLYEVDAGTWRSREGIRSLEGLQFTLQGKQAIELTLHSSQQKVLMDVSYQSIVGRHHFSKVYIKLNTPEAQWQSADKLYLLIALVRETYHLQTRDRDKTPNENIKENEIELISRLIQSYQIMTDYIEARINDPSLRSLEFIDTEQSALYGHWLHPTPKSRQGIAFWQHAHYTPELKGEFKLHYFSVAKELVIEGSVLERSTSEILHSEITKYQNLDLKKGHVFIPIHPLQAHYLLLQDEIKELLDDGRMVYLGEQGAKYTATSSVRTLFNEDSEWMLKFSIPVKITNSLRANMRDELEDGMAVEKYLRNSGFFETRTNFKLIDDPAYISVNLPGKEDTESGFEVLLRRNLFTKGKGYGVCSILSLCQCPIGHNNSLIKDIVEKLASKENRSLKEVSLDWFQAYWECSIESLILLFDQHGISLEAHQQNSLIDVSGGYPSCYYYRDNQGFYMSRQYSDLQVVEDMLTMSELFYDDKVIFKTISYYAIINQLFAMIYRFGADGLIEEDTLIELCRQNLIDLKPKMKKAGADFIDYILSETELGFKANFLSRVNDINELDEGVEYEIFNSVANPLFSGTMANTEGNYNVG